MPRLDMEIKYLKNVGPARAEVFRKMGIVNLSDLLFYFPRKFIDRTTIKPIISAKPGEKETLTGHVAFIEELKPRRNLYIFKAILRDNSGYITAVWFNNRYLAKSIKQGMELMVTGKVEYRFGKTEINVSEFEIIDEPDNTSVNFGRIVPIYPALPERLSQKVFRAIMHQALGNCLQSVKEILPQHILEENQLISRKEAVYGMHFPKDLQEFEIARKRMAFEELFLLQLALQYGRTILKTKTTQPLPVDNSFRKAFLDLLPFELTNAQKKVLSEIDTAMGAEQPMARLVQGDVGSGKTIIAHLAILTAVANNCQAALMAPTEILAEQHYIGLKEYFDQLGFQVAFLKGGMRKKEKSAILEGLATGDIAVVVGTHAVIQKEVNFNKLALAVIDEQHRFGVRQRMALESKGSNPHVLVMTATPIPRTLAMTLYSDLDVSVIDQLPPGRKPIKTYHVRYNMLQRIHAFFEKELAQGRQCYYVCPLVEESEKLDLEAATTLYENLKENYPNLNIGLMHGKLPQSDKEEVMQKFRSGEIQLLVATTVVEVGVNVPNASIMIIKDAERFGLAQLHQLRGRIGRGEYQSYCILLAEPKTEEGFMRMKIMEKSNDGFYIAEEDLKMRGPGEFLGTRQHGISEIKTANLIKDVELMAKARNASKKLLEADPKLAQPLHHGLLEIMNNIYFSLA